MDNDCNTMLVKHFITFTICDFTNEQQNHVDFVTSKISHTWTLIDGITNLYFFLNNKNAEYHTSIYTSKVHQMEVNLNTYPVEDRLEDGLLKLHCDFCGQETDQSIVVTRR